MGNKDIATIRAIIETDLPLAITGWYARTGNRSRRGGRSKGGHDQYVIPICDIQTASKLCGHQDSVWNGLSKY
ncbi:hypothetical protein [Bradyrhizobium sp. CCBAU 51627]|uniref:hypothetical protein n=1 Tax=Bradyrhizobium sp. CCBAU 51627 TaxID=1325088 RepID=UPI002304F9CF|nr:hypothetical protein [Bradyrhizobium sp. CCBAU 51627]